MDPSLLQQFRQQLASWIEKRLESQRLPFQRLELCPRTLTDRGRLIPDLVLWINRSSQLAGSMILLPDVVNDLALAEGCAIASALGLGHFTTWAAREVSIWNVTTGEATLLETFELPPASHITPQDFQDTLDDLLERLKVVTVTSAPSTAAYSEYYFANLCLRNLQELTPGLTISARMTAGKTAADEWVKHAPREKAWMCLWRMLFLLQKERLPPGLQPDRLEFAIRYALADLIEDQPHWLSIQEGEPPLLEEDAVRLHHLAGRLRQLGWPHGNEQAERMVDLLLNEAAQRFGIQSPRLPWPTTAIELWVNAPPTQTTATCAIVAPRAYLAGWAFKTSLNETTAETAYAEALDDLDAIANMTNALAIVQETQTPDRKQRDARLILLRQVWPSRRFDLPRNTPAWIWDVLYLVGLVAEELSLVMPPDWHSAPGIQALWTILAERYQLADLAIDETGRQALHFTRLTEKSTGIIIHRNGQAITLSRAHWTAHKPGTTQVWLKAENSIIELCCAQTLSSAGTDWTDEPESLSWGTYIFLHSRLGRYLWGLCTDKAPLPEYDAALAEIENAGMPLPGETVLADLGLIGIPETGTVPETEGLEREFANIFGAVQVFAESSEQTTPDTTRARRKSTAPVKDISAKVFADGIPRFPEHYLMHLYRPELTRHEIKGVLEITAEFFDKISLQTTGKDQSIEVSGKLLAEALVLASFTGQTSVALPNDEHVLEEIVQKYRADLARLRELLESECRRFEPHRQAAIKLAGKIWQQQGLPPESSYKIR